METQTETAVKRNKGKVPALPEELKAQFTAYFMQRYPLTKKIKIKRQYARYLVKVHYRGENPRRTFRTTGRTYEQLVMRTEYCYSVVRGLPPATNY